MSPFAAELLARQGPQALIEESLNLGKIISAFSAPLRF
jgi:hypothetical protein